ncbi:MAG: phosphoenolpyruvate carboxylase [Pseudomonadota bacterium]
MSSGRLAWLGADDIEDAVLKRFEAEEPARKKQKKLEKDAAKRSKAVSDEATRARARRFRARHDGDPAAVIANALDRAGIDTPDALRAALDRLRAGVVFTAHPTFAAPRALREAVGAYGETGDETALALTDVAHHPDDPLTLEREHGETLTAIDHAQRALAFLDETLCRWADERGGDAGTPFDVAPLSLATWVGYDLDGRTDIHWGQTFRLRLEEKAAQLTRYADAIARVADLPTVARLREAAAFAGEQAAAFDGDLDDPAVAVRAANRLTADDPRRLVDLSPIAAALCEHADAETDATVQRALLRIARDMDAYGLGVARIHLRVNAAQVRSALRADLDLGDERGFLDRTILSVAAERSRTARPRRVNMASVFAERMTARRQFMLCAQFKKHIDAKTPIRFLIAECEAPATVMGAVFLARLYGVDDLVDISPLFETPSAIERGGRLMERLLSEEAFTDYIKRRGRVCIQLGFSDSGRFMGQLPAAMAVERLHILLARALKARGLTQIEAVLFNTHGESMGRGAYPGALDARFDHLLTPWTRSKYAAAGVRLNAESSVQGGDGFLHFQTPALARATIAHLFAWMIAPPQADHEDRYYTDINFTWDVYRGAKAWQEALFDDVDYHVTLSTFAPNLLVKTGSRRVRRQAADPARAASPRSMRAIPNNAILQQLCAPANVFGGLASAGVREMERFSAWAQQSTRARRLVAYAAAARDLTDFDILRAYASLYDATLWRVLDRGASAEASAAPARIAERLAEQTTHTALSRLANHLEADAARFDALRAELEDGDDAARARAPLRLLHAVRLALIMHGLSLVAAAPAFSPRHDLTRGALIDRALALEFGDVADLLATIFPVSPTRANALDGVDEEADADEATGRGYPDIHVSLIEPLRRVGRGVHEISVGVAHFYDAWG